MRKTTLFLASLLLTLVGCLNVNAQQDHAIVMGLYYCGTSEVVTVHFDNAWQVTSVEKLFEVDGSVKDFKKFSKHFLLYITDSGELGYFYPQNPKASDKFSGIIPGSSIVNVGDNFVVGNSIGRGISLYRMKNKDENSLEIPNARFVPQLSNSSYALEYDGASFNRYLYSLDRVRSKLHRIQVVNDQIIPVLADIILETPRMIDMNLDKGQLYIAIANEHHDGLVFGTSRIIAYAEGQTRLVYKDDALFINDNSKIRVGKDGDLFLSVSADQDCIWCSNEQLMRIENGFMSKIFETKKSITSFVVLR